MVQKTCNHICIINEGQIVVNDSLEKLQNKYSKLVFNIKLSLEEIARRAAKILRNKYAGLEIEKIKKEINIIEGPQRTYKILKILIENNIEVSEASKIISSLEGTCLNVVEKGHHEKV